MWLSSRAQHWGRAERLGLLLNAPVDAQIFWKICLHPSQITRPDFLFWMPSYLSKCSNLYAMDSIANSLGACGDHCGNVKGSGGTSILDPFAASFCGYWCTKKDCGVNQSVPYASCWGQGWVSTQSCNRGSNISYYVNHLASNHRLWAICNLY